MKVVIAILITLAVQSSFGALIPSGTYESVGTWSDLNGHYGVAQLKWTQDGNLGMNDGVLIDTSTDGASKYPDMHFLYNYSFSRVGDSDREFSIDLETARGKSTVGNMRSTNSDYVSTLSQPDLSEQYSMDIVEMGHFYSGVLNRRGTITLANGNVIFYSTDSDSKK